MCHNLIKAGRLCMYYLYVQFEFAAMKNNSSWYPYQLVSGSRRAGTIPPQRMNPLCSPSYTALRTPGDRRCNPLPW